MAALGCHTHSQFMWSEHTSQWVKGVYVNATQSRAKSHGAGRWDDITSVLALYATPPPDFTASLMQARYTLSLAPFSSQLKWQMAPQKPLH